VPDVEGGILPPGIGVSCPTVVIYQMVWRGDGFSAGLGSPALRQARMPDATICIGPAFWILKTHLKWPAFAIGLKKTK